MKRALALLLALVVAIVGLAICAPTIAGAHIGEQKPRIEGRKRPEKPRDGPRGRAEVTLENARGDLLRLAPADREMVGNVVVKNVGDGPLEVYRIGFEVEEGAPRAPAGVGISSAAREAKPLAPGEARTFTIRWRWEETRASQLFGYIVVETDSAAPGADTFDPPKTFAVAADQRPVWLRHALTILALFPLLVALVALIVKDRLGGRSNRFAPLWGLGSVLAGVLLLRFSKTFGRDDGGWGLQHVERFRLFGDVEYFVGVDGVSGPLLPVLFIVLAVAGTMVRPARSAVTMMVLGGVLASASVFFVISQTLVLSAVSLTIMCAAASGLAWTSVDRSEPSGRAAAMKTTLALGVSAVLFIVLAFAVAKNAFPSRLIDGTIANSTFAIPEIAREAAHGHAAVDGTRTLLGLPFARGAVLLALLAFAFLAMAAPLHAWPADLAQRAPGVPVAFIVAATSLTSGVGLVRFTVGLFPDATRAVGPVFLGLGLATLLLAGLRATVEDDVRALAGRIAVATGGLSLIALGSLTPQGIQGHLAIVMTRTLAVPFCFVLASMVADRLGTASLTKVSGLGAGTPRLAIAWVAVFAASCALPGTSGFWAVFLGIVGAAGRSPWFSVALGGGLLLLGVGAMRSLRVVIGPIPGWWRTSPVLEPHGGKMPDLREMEWFVWIVVYFLVALAFVSGSFWDRSAMTVLDIFRALEPVSPTQVY